MKAHAVDGVNDYPRRLQRLLHLRRLTGQRQQRDALLFGQRALPAGGGMSAAVKAYGADRHGAQHFEAPCQGIAVAPVAAAAAQHQDPPPAQGIPPEKKLGRAKAGLLHHFILRKAAQNSLSLNGTLLPGRHDPPPKRRGGRSFLGAPVRKHLCRHNVSSSSITKASASRAVLVIEAWIRRSPTSAAARPSAIT